MPEYTHAFFANSKYFIMLSLKMKMEFEIILSVCLVTFEEISILIFMKFCKGSFTEGRLNAMLFKSTSFNYSKMVGVQTSVVNVKPVAVNVGP
jgi:hypothetical protein